MYKVTNKKRSCDNTTFALDYPTPLPVTHKNSNYNDHSKLQTHIMKLCKILLYEL